MEGYRRSNEKREQEMKKKKRYRKKELSDEMEGFFRIRKKIARGVRVINGKNVYNRKKMKRDLEEEY